MIFFVGKWQAIFERKGGGFKKGKSGRNGAYNSQQNKKPEKGDYKKGAFNEKNQNQTEKFVPKETYDLNSLPRRENCI